MNVANLDETIALAESLYNILKAENLFKKAITGDDRVFRIDRLRHQLNILARKECILENHMEEYIAWCNSKTLAPPVTKAELLIEMITLWCNYGLVHYELLKRFFLAALNVEQLPTLNRKITTRSTHGAIVKSFELLPNFTSKMAEMLDNNLRNALAHDSWYVESNQFTYKSKDKHLIRMSFQVTIQKLKNIGQTYSTIHQCYMQDFMPEILQDYEEIGQTNVDKMFPIYGMNAHSCIDANSNKRPGFGYINKNGELDIYECPSDIASFLTMNCKGCISWIASGMIPNREIWVVEHGGKPYPFSELYNKYGDVWNEDLYKIACSKCLTSLSDPQLDETQIT